MNSIPAGYQPVYAQDLSFLWLEITPKCNLECIHCYADSGPQQRLFGTMTTEQWLTILLDAASVGCRQVQFIGGEPTLHPDLGHMISFASEHDYTFIEVFTNATRIDDCLLRTFVEHRTHIAVSFYSDDPETHDIITKRRGSFARTVENLDRILSAGLRVRVGIIEMPENSGHAESAKLFLAKMGIRDVRVDLQRGIGRAAKRMASPEPMQELCGECWKGKLCVTSAGRAYPCVFSRFADLGAATDGIRSIATGHLLLDFRARLKRFREEREDSSAPIISEAEATGLSLRAGCDPACAPTRCSPCDPSGFERCVPKCLPSANWYWGEKDFEEGLRGARVSIEAERATSSNLSTPSPAPRGARKPCDPLSSKCDPNVFPRKPPAGVTPENAVGGAK